MKITNYAAALLLGASVLAGCGSSGQQAGASGAATVAGKVADGYLVNAVVFLDKNGNYQLDAGEPNTTTDATGAFTLTVDPADAGKYPIVVLAIKDQTIDLDTNTKVASSYVLSMHGASVTATTAGTASGTVSNFISPISTLTRETLEANPGMTLSAATEQVRIKLNIPATVPVHDDYVLGSQSGDHKDDYKRMHQTAQTMAGLMGDQSKDVMTGEAPRIDGYRAMVGQIGSKLTEIENKSKTMDDVRTEVHTAVIEAESKNDSSHVSSDGGSHSDGEHATSSTTGSTTSSTTSTTGSTTTTSTDGATLYAQNCAGCHGALASSSKRMASASQISSALSSIGAMNSISLTSAQISSIATALNF